MTRKRDGLRAAPLAAAALCLVLGSCASSGDHAVMLFADPSKYEFYNCQQLASARNSSVARHDELKGLIDRAEQGTGGVFVGAIAYRSEYSSVGETIAAIDIKAREKKCPPPPPAPAAAGNNKPAR